MLDKDPTVNVKNAQPTLIKARTVQQAAEGGKMGWSVPKETVDFFTDIRKPLIRSTPLSTLDRCPRKFLYEYRLGIQTKTYEGALSMGSIVHKMLEALFMGRTTEEASEVALAIFTKEQVRLAMLVDDMGFVGGQPIDKVLRTVEQDYFKARAMALAFWSTTPFDPAKYEVLRTPEGVPMVEQQMDFEYPGLSRPFRCPCDLALLEKGTDNVWIVDYKTTTYPTKMRLATTGFSTQMSLYRLALQTYLDHWHEQGLAPERKVIGGIHAVIQRPTIGYCPNTKDKSGFHSYIERMIKWYKDAETKDPNSPPLVTDPHRFTGALMSRELWGRLKQFTKAAQATPNIDHFYRNDGACLMYNKVCPFARLCNSSPAMWPQEIRANFQLGFREDEEDKDNG